MPQCMTCHVVLDLQAVQYREAGRDSIFQTWMLDRMTRGHGMCGNICVRDERRCCERHTWDRTPIMGLLFRLLGFATCSEGSNALRGRWAEATSWMSRRCNVHVCGRLLHTCWFKETIWRERVTGIASIQSTPPCRRLPGDRYDACG